MQLNNPCFIAMMLRYDFLKSVTQSHDTFTIENFEKLKDTLNFTKAYFYTSFIGYSMGLLATIMIYRIFNSAQPALLYINPFMLITTMLMAFLWRNLKSLFRFDEDKFIEDYQRSI